MKQTVAFSLLVALTTTQAAFAGDPEADVETLRDVISREVEFLAQVGGLTAEETESLRQERENFIRSRIGATSSRRPLVRINGRIVPVGETTGELLRNDLALALKTISRSGWDKFYAERERLDTRRRRAAIMSQVASLDETLLLTAEQRTRLCELLVMRQTDAWWRPTSLDSPLLHPAERMQALIAGHQLGAFVIPKAQMAAVLRPAQLPAFDELRPIREIIVLIQESAPKKGPGAQLVGNVPNPSFAFLGRRRRSTSNDGVSRRTSDD